MKTDLSGAQTPQRTITGNVTDKENKPLPGETIIVPGTQAVINIQLEEKVDEPDELTVVAFGKQKKESVTFINLNK